MKAVILAAGIGTRLRPLTYSSPKCLVKVNGKPVLENTLEHLDRNGIERVILVVGHLGGKVRQYFSNRFGNIELVYLENPIFDSTNNIYSLWLAKEYLSDDLLLFEDDIFFEAEVIDRLCKHDRPNIIVVDEYQSFMDGTVVIADQGIVTEMILKKAQLLDKRPHHKLKTVNIYKFSKEFMDAHFIPALESYIDQNHLNEFYEMAISRIIKSNTVQLTALSVAGLKWYEIDTPEDLKRAEKLFRTSIGH